MYKLKRHAKCSICKKKNTALFLACKDMHVPKLNM